MKTRSVNQEALYVFITSLFFPFIGLVLSLCYWQKSWAKNIFWIACTYMGAIMIYSPEGEILGSGMDSGRYVLSLIDMHNNQHVTIRSIMSLYMKEINYMDLYQQVLTFIVSRFTNNGHVLFAVFAFIFGYFYSRNMWYVFEKLPQKGLGLLYVLFALYLLVCPISQINGVRMWTALHVFVYAMLPYLIERDKSKLWLLILTPLIHFSYLYVVILTFVYVLLPYRFKTNNLMFVYLVLLAYVITLFINSINLGTVSSMMEEISPESYENRIDVYVNQDVLDRRNEALSTNNWYIAVGKNIANLSYSIILILILPILRKYFKYNRPLMNLYVFTLLIGAFANITALIPSGGRFQLLSTMFKLPIILMVVLNIPKKERIYKITKIICIPLLLTLVVEIRRLFDFYGITLLFGNFITVFFWENNIPLIVFIKQLFT